VPASQCGSIIGKGGSKIKEIREVTYFWFVYSAAKIHSFDVNSHKLTSNYEIWR
jgi:predicted RNA-binding protein YlqC (UPF0109 family)